MLGEVNTRKVMKYEYDVKLSDKSFISKNNGTYQINSVMTDDMMKAITPVQITDGGTYNVVPNFETIPPNKYNKNNETNITKVLYNKVIGTFSWIVKADMNNLINNYYSGCGTSDNAISISELSYATKVEIYNGTLWSISSSNMVRSRNSCGVVGLPTSAVAFGGIYGSNASNLPTITERFDGSTWSSLSAPLNNKRRGLVGCGVTNSALAICGRNNSSVLNYNEYFNGSSWVNGVSMLASISFLAGCGGPNGALVFGGTNNVVEYKGTLATTYLNDGYSWSAKNNMNTARSSLAGCGTPNNALSICGSTSSITELYNGSSWSVRPSTNYTRNGPGGCGESDNALVFGGGGVQSTELGLLPEDSYTKLNKSQYNDSVFSNWANNDTIIGKLTSSTSLDLLGY